MTTTETEKPKPGGNQDDEDLVSSGADDENGLATAGTETTTKNNEKILRILMFVAIGLAIAVVGFFVWRRYYA